MPNLPHSTNPSAGDLHNYLKSVLPNSQLTNATVDSAYQPLLLLQTKHVMAAFAFSNDNIRMSYDALYGGLKNHYTEQRGHWDAFDLAFVFCVPPDEPNLDNFCSNVETDVYFCRKFVVPLSLPLGDSLARLPFLPLTPPEGRSLRPASAQTFLQQCGVPAMLARYLVVQHERGPGRIVEDCINGEFGEPRVTRALTSIANSSAAQGDRNIDPVRLETVSITNFRAYRKPQIFEVGADVTVLYGPNGFGKTSFFDAIDFAMTGGIGRLESHREVNFPKTARHLDSNSEESLVSLSFRCKDSVRRVTRNVSDRKQALLDDRPTDRKTILSELTGGNSPTADRVENFVSLFRATHLFSQEQQELTKDFQDDCRLSAQIVSRMLAFEDYANAVSKTAKVREVLQTTIVNATAEIRDISEQIATEKRELHRLGQTAKVQTDVHTLNTEIEALRDKLVAAGIDVGHQPADAAILRGWRATLEARNGDSQSLIDRYSTLVKEVTELRRTRNDLANLQQQLSQKEHALGAAEEKRIAAELALQHAEKRLAQMGGKCTETQTHADILEWVRTTKPIYAQLIVKQRTLTDDLNRLDGTLTQHHITEENEASDLRKQESYATLATEKLKTKRGELSRLHSLNESIASWEANRARLTALVESEQTAVKSLESLRTEERELSPQVRAVTSEEARLSRQIAEVDKSQSELNNLLSQLQGHIHTGTCPLCGEDHGTKYELVRRIQKHVVADAASEARVELAGVRERAKQLAEMVSSNNQKQRAVETQRAEIIKERARLEDEIILFANSAGSLGIILEAYDKTPAEQLQSRHNQIQQEIGELNRQIQEIGVAKDAAHTRLTNTKALLVAKAAEIADKKVALAQLQEEANHLRGDPRQNLVSLDIDDEQLKEIERLNRAQLTGFKAEMAKAQVEVAEMMPAVKELQQESTSVKFQLTALRAQLANLQTMVTKITSQFEEFRLPVDSSEEMLLNLIAEESRAQAQYLALRDSVSNIEMGIDAATTAAALTQLQHNVQDKEKAVVSAERKRDQHQPWRKYFDELSRLVSSQQNEAIANFTREYGPRTSVIQRRLRSVYGFDDIEIRSRESAISVRVKRHGEELRPTDYFSQSQQQTLLLGLFLTACSSQTWSAFSPVFLDDPVTHFDDLNTYALLDLIVGLLESEFGKRQFIISTCDEKLLQLARQKFRHLGGRAKFYRFSAISAEGPVVDEIAVPLRTTS